MTSLPITQRQRRALGDIIAGRHTLVADTSPNVSSAQPEESGNWLSKFMEGVEPPTSRKREMEYYDYLERQMPDVRKALDAFATMAVTGNLAGGGANTFTIEPLGDDYPEELLNRFRALNRYFNRIAYAYVRAMCQYGTFTPEIMPGRMPDNRFGVQRCRPLPPGTIFRNVSKKTEPDPSKYWYQTVDGVPGGKVDIPRWKLADFSAWTNVVSATNTVLYGTSILKPVGAIALKLHASIDALVVARLSRAAMRYVWSIDVSDIRTDADAIMRRIRVFEQAKSRSRNLLGDSGQDSYQKPPGVPDADIYVPSGEGLSWGVDKIDGDQNLGNVGDIEMLARFYFGALGVPPEYLGHERSQGGRSNLSQVDINFARTARHIQGFACSGFEHIVAVDMILGGWSPIDYPFVCNAPKIGARDDLLQAQIRALQSTVIANLAASGLNLTVDPKWILQTFMNMDDELDGLDDDVIESLFETVSVTNPDDPGRRPTDGEVERVRQQIRASCGDLFAMVRETWNLLGQTPSGNTDFHALIAEVPKI